MDLFRLHAYSVHPQRTSNKGQPPPGGAVGINTELRSILAENTRQAEFANKPGIVFELDPTSRTNEVREMVIAFGFGDSTAARAAALGLAARLANAMDNRSSPCLFVPSAFHGDGGSGTVCVILWLFPREAAFRLTTAAGTASIEVITEAFSQQSRHKKAGLFQGKNVKTAFLEGRVLDHQASNVNLREVADFWVKRFLAAAPSLKAEAGTRILAKVLREAYEAATTTEGRDGLHAAILGVRTGPERRLSLKGFAQSRLDGEARQRFLERVPNDETGSAVFDFDRTAFESILQFRLFELKKGVFVSAPFGQVGESVRIVSEEKGRRVLTCRDEIVGEKLRTRHA